MTGPASRRCNSVRLGGWDAGMSNLSLGRVSNYLISTGGGPDMARHILSRRRHRGMAHRTGFPLFRGALRPLGGSDTDQLTSHLDDSAQPSMLFWMVACDGSLHPSFPRAAHRCEGWW